MGVTHKVVDSCLKFCEFGVDFLPLGDVGFDLGRLLFRVSFTLGRFGG